MSSLECFKTKITTHIIIKFTCFEHCSSVDIMLTSPSSDDLWFENSQPRHRQGHQQHSNIWTLSSLQLYPFFQRGIYPITFSDNIFAQSSQGHRNPYLRFMHTRKRNYNSYTARKKHVCRCSLFFSFLFIEPCIPLDKVIQAWHISVTEPAVCVQPYYGQVSRFTDIFKRAPLDHDEMFNSAYRCLTTTASVWNYISWDSISYSFFFLSYILTFKISFLPVNVNVLWALVLLFFLYQWILFFLFDRKLTQHEFRAHQFG